MTDTTPAAVLVGEEVRALLARRRVSQVELAAHIGISMSSMHRRLLGTQPFTVNEIVDAAQLLQVPASALLGPLDSLAEITPSSVA
ncbi:helix-turn-helix domain-containing protein [Rhodococcus sp. 06-418-5]|uniref:helix-turn-helix domain-containing protein n=1 Tax=Rhodococcus sp. 06-418-5 TaxID=2022507 RepID=UPI0015C61D13|nr:helix-turn-helix domain-containing protein [Rhodococcus sp. 06-418-5]